MNSSQRVIYNTLFLYLNMMVTLIVQLVAVRWVFASLGMVDYGIYSLIAGVVAMFAFMNVAMQAATQRFLSYALGTGEEQHLKDVFYDSVILHAVIACVFLFFLESIGLFYIRHILTAPIERIGAAQLLLHCIALSTIVNILTVPYEAAITAHEDMGAIAIINIMEALCKLGVAYYLQYASHDRLIVYGVLTMMTMIGAMTLKCWYCNYRYAEVHFHFHRITDFSLMRKIGAFALWNFIGAGCGIARYQGTAVVLNYFKGILTNAAYGVAQQVNGLLLFFANSIVRAVRPQIVKSEGTGNRQRMLSLASSTCKITSLLVAFVAIPLFCEMSFVLQLWLGKVPTPETVALCRSFLVITYIYQLTIGLQVAIESEGRIKLLQLVVGTMHILALPVGALLFYLYPSLPSVVMMLCIIVEELIGFSFRVFIAYRLTGLCIREFLLRTIAPSVLLVLSVFTLCEYVSNHLLSQGLLNCSMVALLSTVFMGGASYAFILNQKERSVIDSFVGHIRSSCSLF